jgi:hypothetical protein
VDRRRRDACYTVRMEYVSRVPRAPLDGLIDDLYYLEGAPPYARLTLPPMPAAELVAKAASEVPELVAARCRAGARPRGTIDEIRSAFGGLLRAVLS